MQAVGVDRKVQSVGLRGVWASGLRVSGEGGVRKPQTLEPNPKSQP